MGHNGHIAAARDKPAHFQPPAFLTPTVIYLAERIPQPDGTVVFRAGRPVIVPDEIGTAEVARLLGMSRRWVNNQCEIGRFKTAHKPGLSRSAWWKISRAEVLAIQHLLPD